MATVYSTRFIALDFQPTGTSSSYFVPAGFVAIVRDVDVRFHTLSPIVYVSIIGISEFLELDKPAADVIAAWRGRQVLNAGEELNVFIGGTGSASAAVSGYLLSS